METLYSIDNGICHAKLIEVLPPSISHETYYSSRYLISQFPPEGAIVNVLLHRCCEPKIDLRRKKEGVVFLKRVY